MSGTIVDTDLRLLVFTDLDGTLLEHGSYSHAPAAPALAALRRLDVPLILASSKTAAEIAPLHRELGLGDWPAIVENGAGLYEPGTSAVTEGPDYLAIRQALDDLPTDLRALYQGFGDMSVADVVAATGLPSKGAEMAQMRAYSEPGTFTGDKDQEAAFLEALATRGIAGRRGGRFLTLSMGRTKADAMAEVVARLNADTTIALGDAPNDTEMLAAADYGVWIHNDHAPTVPRLPGEDDGRIRHTTESGPTGWNIAVLQLLNDLTLI